MVDHEVEDTLREIRERVLAESAQAAGPLAVQPNGPAANGADAGQAAQANGRAPGEALARLQANLATTERAWSRLPPLVSYRRGLAARLELWVKRQIKRAAHWFTWEQVNFNSAVHHALGDAHEALAAHEQRLAAHEHKMVAHEQAAARAEADIAALSASFRQLRSEADNGRARLSELQARLAAAESRFDGALAQLRHALAAGVEQLRAEARALAEETRAEQHAFVEGIRTDQRALAEGLRDEQRAQIQARAAELLSEMRERAERLLEEQRVCFKQLSLEVGEAAVTHDRARRQIETRLEALEKP
ncbi:MAG: hypothetical protein DMF67_20260 [Acidobacteria bacterium]|nr:MAG: hypothetical protein DMF67_20260 [Acidobacteriota bacterium]